MDIKLIGSFIDAVDRTHVDAGAVFRILAGFSYYVGHVFSDGATAALA
jgi:hypothetical protein